MSDWQGRRYFKTPATAPGPSGPEMLPAFRAIRENPLRFLEKMWKEYGDVVQFPIPSPPTYLVVNPVDVRRVLVTNARAYGKNTIQYNALSLVTGEGLLTSDTPEWKRQRPLVQPAFHHETIDRVADHVNGAADRLLQEWQGLPEGAVIDVDDAMMHTALDVVGWALFGSDLSDDADQLVRATLAALDVVIARARVPISPPRWIPTPGNIKLRKAVSRLDEAVTAMVAERRLGGDHPGDMLDLLMQQLPKDQVRDQIATFIVAGHETVATSMTWALYLLSVHPNVAARVAQEVLDVCGTQDPQIADFENLALTRAVLDETLRLYPPAWLITRKAMEPDVLGSSHIPEGALIIVSPWLSHRHPQAWGNPETFEPERFLGNFDRQAFIPFGAGPRLCIGRDFAIVESVLLLAKIVRAFDLEYVGESPTPEPKVTVRPAESIRLRISPRA